ncbi:MAG: glycosyltransferase family 4 protein [Candidatus Bathyarchaeia archaeon]
MNIWIFNQYAVTPDLPGGTRHYDLGQELARRGHHVVIIATSFHHHMHKETRLKPGERWKIENVNGVKFVWLRTPSYWRNDWRRVWNMLVFALRAWRFGQKLPKLAPEVGRPEVVIGSSPHLLIPLAAYWVARHYRVPFVMEVRDLWPQTIIDMGKLSATHPIIKVLQALERFLYRQAKLIITVLPQAHKYITALGIPQERIFWIPNGVDLSRFGNLEPPSAVAEIFKVMYLGAHGQANALDVLIHAAKVVQDRGFAEIRFILVGEGPEKPRLMALAQELRLANVEFREPVPKNEVPTLLHTADATIFILHDITLYKYGISLNKLFDYLAAGKPVVIAGKPANNPVEEARCGLTVPPREPQALAEAVIKLYQMPREEREAMGRRGREYVEKHHNITRLAEHLEKALLQAIQHEANNAESTLST